MAHQAGLTAPILLPGHRVLLGLWETSHRELSRHPAGRWLAEAAVAAVLATLRHECPDRGTLLRYYDDDAGNAADFGRIASLVGRVDSDGYAALAIIREAACWERWRDLAR
jgi:hypothetical protein